MCIYFSDEHDLVFSMHLNNQPFCIRLVDVQDIFNLTSGDFHSLWCDCIKKMEKKKKKAATYYRKGKRI